MSCIKALFSCSWFYKRYRSTEAGASGNNEKLNNNLPFRKASISSTTRDHLSKCELLEEIENIRQTIHPRACCHCTSLPLCRPVPVASSIKNVTLWHNSWPIYSFDVWMTIIIWQTFLMHPNRHWNKLSTSTHSMLKLGSCKIITTNMRFSCKLIIKMSNSRDLCSRSAWKISIIETTSLL